MSGRFTARNLDVLVEAGVPLIGLTHQLPLLLDAKLPGDRAVRGVSFVFTPVSYDEGHVQGFQGPVCPQREGKGLPRRSPVINAGTRPE